MKTRTYQIKEVAELAGVSTRTLRHYDELGLLTPTHRSAAGYRLYNDADLLRLQQILIGRELGLALEAIRETIDDPHADQKGLLLKQRAALVTRAQATEAMIRSIDAALARLDKDSTQETPIVDMKQLFNGFDPERHEQEVRERWGATDAYKESARRTRKYGERDWVAIKSESEKVLQDAVALLRSGVDSESAAAMDIAERYRLWVDRWFYPCAPGAHAYFAEMYEGDPRFAKYFNDFADGLAAFVSGAIRANARRNAASA